MTKTEALKTWSEACVVVEAGTVIVREGNWMTMARALHYCADTSTVDERADKLNGDTVVKVTPAERKQESPGKQPINLAPFLLVVR